MFGSLMGDGFDDMLGGHMRRMNNMMNSFFGNPFGGDMLAGGNEMARRSGALMPFENPGQNMFSPFGFPAMNQIMQSANQMPDNPNCHSFSSSSVMTMTTGPDGKPQVYQASASTRNGPGGVRETKKSVCDSRTGLKKLAVGRHIGDRGHVKEREQNIYNGQTEENDEYINLDEEEEPEFNNEWKTKTRQYAPRHQQALSYHQSPYANYNNNEYLALPPAPASSSAEQHDRNLKEESQQKKKTHRAKPYNNKRKEKRSQE